MSCHHVLLNYSTVRKRVKLIFRKIKKKLKMSLIIKFTIKKSHKKLQVIKQQKYSEHLYIFPQSFYFTELTICFAKVKQFIKNIILFYTKYIFSFILSICYLYWEIMIIYCTSAHFKYFFNVKIIKHILNTLRILI